MRRNRGGGERWAMEEGSAPGRTERSGDVAADGLGRLVVGPRQQHARRVHIQRDARIARERRRAGDAEGGGGMVVALMLVWHLSMHLPRFEAAGLGAGLSMVGTVPCVTDSVDAWWQQQSPTWLAHGDDPLWWALVPPEATPRRVL